MLRSWLREPLVHFVAIGALLFLLFAWKGGGGSNRIVVTPGEVESMVAAFNRTWQRQPTEQELKGLLDDRVRDEMAVREAVSLGLDRDDTVIRRRLRQKIEFIVEGDVDASAVSDADLQAFLDKHPDQYRLEPRMTFRQVYLSPNRHGASLDYDGQALLAKLGAAGEHADISRAGDSLMLPAELTDAGRGEVARQFGETFADALVKAPTRTWTGPIPSGFGMHVVFIRERVDGRAPRLADVRAEVERDLEPTAGRNASTRCTAISLRATGSRSSHERPTRGRTKAKRRRRSRAPNDETSVCARTADSGAGSARRGRARDAAGLSRTARDRSRHVQLPLEEARRRRGRNLHAPMLPKECRLTTSGQQALTPGALVVQGVLTCDDGIEGRTLAIDGLAATVTDVLVRVHHADGRLESHLLKPMNPSVTLGARTSTWERAAGYVRLGVEHILLGVDHLLFVLGLLLIVSDRRMLLKTITSFTLAHSMTLAIATLGYASAPLPPLNAAIALSILFLGPEIVRKWRGETSFTIEHPWIVAFAFGLLHGFGFASGLTTMGLPQAEIPLALLLFNVGVEIGQLCFVALVVGLERAFMTLEIRWPRAMQALPGYAVGIARCVLDHTAGRDSARQSAMTGRAPRLVGVRDVWVALVLLLTAAAPAMAHPQQGQAQGFFTGVQRPISGLDHVLAMVSVGLWGAQLGAPAVWLLPVAFPMMMAAGGFLGLIGVALPGVEIGIALSALMLGVMVAIEARPPLAVAATLVAFFAIFHGHAHGTELPAGADGLSYSIGFVLATGCLHAIGIAIGVVHKWPAGRVALRVAGSAVAIAGGAFLWRAVA